MESTDFQNPEPRILLDSSVLIAAALSRRGSANDLVLLAAERKVTLIIRPFILSEVERNVARKASARLPNLYDLMESVSFERCEPPASLVVSEAAHVEPKDAEIVAAAVTSKADLLVTYDAKHLLSCARDIERRHGIVVCDPAFAIVFVATV